MPRIVGSDGQVFEVADADADRYLARGYKLETAQQGYQRALDAGTADAYDGVLRTIEAGAVGALRGASLGLSDIAAVAAGGDDAASALSTLKQQHGTASTVGEVAGAIATAIPSAGGSLMARAPAALASRAGTALAAKAGGGSIARAVTAGAVEGAIGNAGMYLSDVALADKDLSAEGFVGSMGQGALWGGAAGGVFGIGEAALTRARRMFPAHEVTSDAVAASERLAASKLDEVANDGQIMAAQARETMAQRRAALAASDIEARQAINAARVEAERLTAAAKVRAAEARAAGVEAKAQATIDKAEASAWKAEAKASAAPTRKAMQPKGEVAPSVIDDAMPPATVADDAAGAGDDLMAQLQGTKAALDDGKTMRELSGSDTNRAAVGDIRAVEDAMNDAAAKFDPELAKLAQAERVHREAADGLESWRMTKEQIRDYASGLKTTAAASAQKRAIDEGIIVRTYRSPGPKGKSVRSNVDVTIPDVDRAAISQMSADDFRVYRDWFNGEPLTGRRVEVDGDMLLDADTGEVLNVADYGTTVSDARTRSSADRIAVGRPGSSLDELAATLNRLGGHTPPKPASVDDAIATALRERAPETGDDIAELAQAVGPYEAAAADLADALGPIAPPSAAARAMDYRAAAANSNAADLGRYAQVTEQLDQSPAAMAEVAKMREPIDTMRAADVVGFPNVPAAPGSAAPGILGKAADMGGMLEVLDQLGIPGIPSVASVPVIGPVLAPLLKARAAWKVYKNLGGKVTHSAEAKVASGAAQTRTRIGRAIGDVFDGAARGAGKAAARAPLPATILAHRLFPGRDDAAPEPPDYADDTQRAYLARLGELAAAKQPGAIQRAIRQRMPGADPRIVTAIEQATERRLSFLESKAAKPPAPRGAFGVARWAPTAAQASSLARYIRAVDDPAGIFERAASGEVCTKEDIETLREVYPRLRDEGQRLLLERAAAGGKVPYAQRVMLSTLFGMPLEPTASPAYISAMQETYAGGQPAAQPPPPGAPPAPGVANPVDLSMFTATGRRAS